MRGSILLYNRNKGLISGVDGNRYEFSRLDWNGKGEPAAGTEIDFVVEGQNARNVFPLHVGSKHSKVVWPLFAGFSVCWVSIVSWLEKLAPVC